MRGLFGWLFGGGSAGAMQGVTNTVRAVVGDRAALDAQNAAIQNGAMGQLAAEFRSGPKGWFDALVDGLNRLPRPVLAFSILGLFAFAMMDPVSFTARMQGLAHVPDPLWWIMGTVIAFYFGARESHHMRQFRAASPADVQSTVNTIRAIEAVGEVGASPQGVSGNPALDAWRSGGAS